MGHALFTKLLTPTLLKTAEELKSDVRVINVSSEDHQLVSGLSIIYEQAKLEGYSTLRLCGQSKLANIMHRRELQTRYPSIMATSVYPGVIVTDPYTAVNASSVIRGGAKNSLWAVTAPKEEVGPSQHGNPVGNQKPGSFWHAQEPQLAEDLREWTEKDFEKKGY